MTWIRIEDTFATHPKILSVDVVDRWKHLEIMLLCGRHGTDGRVTVKTIVRWGVCSRATYARRLCDRLATAGLLDADGPDAWKVHDWSHYQFPASETKRIPTSGAERQRRYRQRKRDETVTTSDARVTVRDGFGSTNQTKPVSSEERARVGEPEPRQDHDAGAARPLSDLLAYRPPPTVSARDVGPTR